MGLLSRLAGLELNLDPHAAGSLQSRREVRASRTLLLSAVPLLLWRHQSTETLSPGVCRQLSNAAWAVEQGKYRSAGTLLEQLDLKSMGGEGTRLWSALHALGAALRQWGQAQSAKQEGGRKRNRYLLLHRDWIGAREAGSRAGGAMLLLGGFWMLTGLSTGAYMLLGLSVMISVFSTFDNPACTMRFIFAGQVLGVLAALVCRWLFWPWANNEFQQILMLFPFLLIGPWLLSHQRTMIAAMDYSMLLLLLSAPHYPLSGSFPASLLMGVSVLAAPLLAWAGYRYIYPVTVQRRQKHLMTLMMQELIDIAGDTSALSRRQAWRMRFYHRALQLVRNAERLGRSHQVLASLQAYQSLAQASYRCQELVSSPYSPSGLRRAASAFLLRVQGFDDKSARMEHSLARLVERLRKSGAPRQEDVALFERAVQAMLVIRRKVLR